MLNYMCNLNKEKFLKLCNLAKDLVFVEMCQFHHDPLQSNCNC